MLEMEKRLEFYLLGHLFSYNQIDYQPNIRNIFFFTSLTSLLSYTVSTIIIYQVIENNIMSQILLHIFTMKWDCEKQLTHTVCACLLTSFPTVFLPCENGIVWASRWRVQTQAWQDKAFLAAVVNGVILFVFHTFEYPEANKHNLLRQVICIGILPIKL